jgi:signal transduction histidine kinase
LPTTVDQAAYRILQEALTNSARHGLGNVDVTIRIGAQQLELTVRNSIPPAAGAWSNGHGLLGMRERAVLLGGSLTAAAEAGAFTVQAILPLTGNAR